MDRIEQLSKFIAARPDDPFPRYALALEHRSRGDAQRAAETLAALVKAKPDYVPAYLILGQLHEQAARLDDARATYRQGQDEARKQGNRHALSELTTSLEQLG